MKTQVSKPALLALQWSLGVIVFIEAARLAFSTSEIHFAGHPGVLHWSASPSPGAKCSPASSFWSLAP